MAKKWIQKSHIHKGALRNKVKRAYGSGGFDSKGRIKISTLHALAHSSSPKTRKQANLALTLRKLHKRKRS